MCFTKNIGTMKLLNYEGCESMKPILIEIYGTEILCASCVNLPSALETKDWLESLLLRKYPEKSFTFEYIDFENPNTSDVLVIDFCEMMKKEDRIYPLVKIGDEIVSEGQVLVKRLYSFIDNM